MLHTQKENLILALCSEVTHDLPLDKPQPDQILDAVDKILDEKQLQEAVVGHIVIIKQKELRELVDNILYRLMGFLPSYLSPYEDRIIIECIKEFNGNTYNIND